MLTADQLGGLLHCGSATRPHCHADHLSGSFREHHFAVRLCALCVDSGCIAGCQLRVPGAGFGDAHRNSAMGEWPKTSDYIGIAAITIGVLLSSGAYQAIVRQAD